MRKEIIMGSMTRGKRRMLKSERDTNTLEAVSWSSGSVEWRLTSEYVMKVTTVTWERGWRWRRKDKGKRGIKSV